mmetsp:Transcript_9228/g.28314  ORF Transcript_9228/g.28314 Transcript_9228/m.28314 type:complete len:238 (-) Transcript_9228:384-1097(-)
MWPKTQTRGLMRVWTSSRRSSQPARLPPTQRSPLPSGGPCVSRTSTSSGTWRHFWRQGVPRPSWKAQSSKYGCHGVPKKRRPRTVVDESSRYVASSPSASRKRRFGPSPSLFRTRRRSTSRARSWLPAMQILRSKPGTSANHRAKSTSSFSDPPSVMSPVCTRTSPSGRSSSRCRLCVSEMHTTRKQSGRRSSVALDTAYRADSKCCCGSNFKSDSHFVAAKRREYRSSSPSSINSP